MILMWRVLAQWGTQDTMGFVQTVVCHTNHGMVTVPIDSCSQCDTVHGDPLLVPKLGGSNSRSLFLRHRHACTHMQRH